MAEIKDLILLKDPNGMIRARKNEGQGFQSGLARLLIQKRLRYIEAIGSSMKIDETWSTVVLRVEAFIEGVVAPFQWYLVNDKSL